MLDRDAALLLEIETAIGQIESFIPGFTETAFINDNRAAAAVSMCLIVIGESARGISDSARGEAPEVPWTQIVGLRNRLAHGYQNIDRAAIWAIVQQDLQPLRTAVRRLLRARGESYT